MTLNGRNAPLTEIKLFYGAHDKNFNEDILMCDVLVCDKYDKYTISDKIENVGP